MPRVYDRVPRATDDHNPLKNLLNFDDITPYTEQAGGAVLAALQNAVKNIIEAITNVIGGGLEDLAAWALALQEQLADVPILGDLIEAFTGVEDGDLSDIGTWVSGLPSQILAFIYSNGGINLAGWDEFIASLNDGKGIDLPVITKLVDALAGIDLDGDPGAVLTAILSAAADFLRGFLPSQLASIDIGVLTNQRRNLLIAGDFGTLASIEDNAKWTFDSTVTRTADGTGSARTIANGAVRALRSKYPVAVAAGQSFKLFTYVKCASIVVSGAAFHLDLVRYSGDPSKPNELVELGVDRLVSVSTGSGSHDWALLEDAFTVAEDGTTCVRARLVVDSNVTSGTVWFDDAELETTGFLLLDWMPEALQKFLAIFNVFGSGGTIEQMQTAWQKLLTLLHIPVNDDLFSLTPAQVWQNVAEFLINPLGFFANLIGGVLPDSQKPQWLSDLTDALSNAASDANDIGTGISNALAGIGRLWGVGNSAQQSADNANIGVQILSAQLNAVGTVGSDEFDYVSANTLPSGSYALSSLGAGAGSYGPDGKGRLVWKPSGFLQRQKIYKRTDKPLETNNGAVTAVWSTKIKDPLFSDGHGYICGRMFDSNNDTRIQADIDNNTARIQVVNSGVVIQIGSSAAVDTSDGDVWEFWYGTLSNPYVFWLKQNGTLVRFGGNTYVEDTGHISGFMLTSNYRMCGFGGQADNYAAVLQIAPPTLNGWTWRDQNLTAVA